jgi:hypothetical protein
MSTESEESEHEPQPDERGFCKVCGVTVIWFDEKEGFGKKHLVPLRKNPDRILAYDEENNVFLLKLDSSQLNTVRASLKRSADFLRGTEFHNDTADELSKQIEQEIIDWMKSL